MNTTRFLNFGKYDLNINKSFYRNLALTSIFGATGIVAIGFLARWTSYTSFVNEQKELGITDPEAILEMAKTFSFTNPEGAETTSFFVMAICLTMMCVFAGYTFHNLRNKQGRVSELTMPATNLERWSWHIGLSIVGGLLVCVASVLCADAVNALLNLIVYGPSVSFSISGLVAKYAGIVIDTDTAGFISPGLRSVETESPALMWGIRAAAYSHVLLQIAAYIYGNSIKYKYNIILTYIALQIVGFIVMIGIVTFAMYYDTMDISFAGDDTDDFGTALLYCIAGVQTIISALLIWGSYRKYCKAQITSRRNK